MREASLSIPLSNIGESRERAERERSKRRGHISELVYAVARAIPLERAATKDGFFGAACELLRGEPTAALTDPSDRAALTEALLLSGEVRFGEEISLADMEGGPKPPPPRSRVAYVRNPYTDLAYQRLSTLLTAPTVGYRESFRELSDDVEGGHADYAVLPMLAGGVRMAAVDALVAERSLFVTATVTIPTRDESVTYALLAREPITHRRPTHFLFRYEPRSVGEQAMLLGVMEALSLFCARADTAPLSYARDRMASQVLAVGEERGLSALLLYLMLYAPDFSGYGFYTELT